MTIASVSRSNISVLSGWHTHLSTKSSRIFHFMFPDYYSGRNIVQLQLQMTSEIKIVHTKHIILCAFNMMGGYRINYRTEY